VANSATPDSSRRKPGWLTLLIVLGVVPFFCAVFVHDLIFDVYGTRRWIPLESAGTGVLHFWNEQGGMLLVPAIIAAFSLLLARRSHILAAAGFAVLAALSTFVLWIAAIMWAVIVQGATLG
jgi:hypothetical protein